MTAADILGYAAGALTAFTFFATGIENMEGKICQRCCP